MFEALDVMHQVERIGAWTGLGGGAIVALAALAYFIAPARSLAIAAGVAIASGYGGLLYGDNAGRSDVTRQWDAANTRAAAAAIARDADAAKATAATYEPAIAAREKTIGDLKRQVDLDEKKLLAAKIGGNACTLGDDAVRLRARATRR